MEELHELIKYLKDNGYEHLKINPDLLIGIIEYFASKQETKQCTITDVSQQRELLPEFLMKDLDGKIVTAYIGGADVTKEWDEYLGNCG